MGPAPADLTFLDHLQTLQSAFSFLYISFEHLCRTIGGQPSLLLRQRPPWAALREAWFASFWAQVGPGVREDARARVVPLLEGRIEHGVETAARPEKKNGGGGGDDGNSKAVHGVVVEVGAGSGMWVDMLASLCDRDTAHGRGRRRIRRIYGIEPNPGSRDALARHIARLGLDRDDTYVIIPAGVEALAERPGPSSSPAPPVKPGTVDCIICVLVLCSIPNPAENLKTLYGLLKKGGRMYVYEHVQAPTRAGVFMACYQRFINLFWPTMVGGCTLCLPTEAYLRQAGPWETIDLAQPPHEPWSAVCPHVIGTLTK